MKLCCALTLLAVATAEIDFTRTINTIPAGSSGSVNISTGCTKTDQYGCAVSVAVCALFASSQDIRGSHTQRVLGVRCEDALRAWV